MSYWLAQVTIPVPAIPTNVGWGIFLAAVSLIGGMYLRFRGRRVMDWGDLIERQEKIIIALDAKVARLEAELESERTRNRSGIEGQR